MAFSQDDNRVMVHSAGYSGDRSTIEVWDVRLRTRIPVANPIAEGVKPDKATFGPDATTVVLTDVTTKNLYDLGSGRLVASFPHDRERPTDDNVAVNGRVLTRCAEDQLHVIDLAGGAELRSVPVPQCTSVRMDASTNYALVTAGRTGDNDSNTHLSVADLRSGNTYRLTLPPVDLDGIVGPISDIVLFPGPDGSPVALAANDDLLYRTHTTSTVSLISPDKPSYATKEYTHEVSPDGSVIMSIGTSGQITLIDPKTNATITSAPGPPVRGGVNFQGVWWSFTPDSRRLLVAQDDSLVVYSVPGLTVERRLDLPVPSNLGPPPGADEGFVAWASSVVPLGNNNAITLHAGMFTRWNLDTGERMDEPLPLRQDAGAARRSALLAVTSRLARPGHPAQIAVIEPGGIVEVWDLDQRRIIATIAVEAYRGPNAVVFDTTGNEIAIRSETLQTTLWLIDENRQKGRVIPTGLGDVLGFTPDYQLVTVDALGIKPTAKIWDVASGKMLATFTGPPNVTSWSLRDGVLSNLGFEQTRSIKLDPQLWFSQLCEASNRPYTHAEIEVLTQHNASADPPCG
jgi:WD40 repeat protein